MNGKIFCAVVLLALSGATLAASKNPAVEDFRGETTYRLFSCGLVAKTAMLRLESGSPLGADSDVGACQKEGGANSRKLFAVAAKQVAKKPAALKFLKSYYAAWLTAFNGVMPDANESASSYDKRQGDAQRKAEELWAQFDIEWSL